MRRPQAAHKLRRLCPASLGAVVAALLVVNEPVPVRAAEADGAHTVDSVLKMMNLKADVGHSAAFVEQSRPGSTDYVPIGRQHQERVIKRKSPADVKAAEAELDAARARQEKATGQSAASIAPAKPVGVKKPAKAALRGTQN